MSRSIILSLVSLTAAALFAGCPPPPITPPPPDDTDRPIGETSFVSADGQVGDTAGEVKMLDEALGNTPDFNQPAHAASPG